MHGCSSHRILLEHEWNYGLSMDALILLKYEWNYGLRIDALGTVCSWNTNGIMVEAWMKLWFGHRCPSHRILLEHERNCGGHACSNHRIFLEHEQNYGLDRML